MAWRAVCSLALVLASVAHEASAHLLLDSLAHVPAHRRMIEPLTWLPSRRPARRAVGPPSEIDGVVIASGEQFACAIEHTGDADAVGGALRCWGQAPHPIDRVPSGTDFVQVAAGRFFACALRAAGSLVCWGKVQHDLPGPYTQISAGDDKLCALRPTGDIDCPQPIRASKPPGEVVYTQVSVGYDHACALARNGTAVCWGQGNEGVRTPEGYQFRQLSVSPRQHTCAITLENEVMCWGRNRAGECVPPFLQAAYRRASRPANEVQLDAAGRVLRTPEEVDADDAAVLPSFKIVSAGQRVSCGLTTEGGLVCWGGCCRDTPQGRYRQLSTGYGHVCAVAEDDDEHGGDAGQARRAGGRVVCWGGGAATRVPEAGVWAR